MTTSFELLEAIKLGTQSAVSVGVAVLAASLTTWFASKRFYRERLWDRRAAAYVVIFESLEDLLEWYSELFEAQISRQDLPEDREKQLLARQRSAREQIKRKIAGEAWLLDERVATEIEVLWSKLRKQWSSYEEDLDESWGAVNDAKLAIRAIAAEDLRLPNNGRKARLWPLLARASPTPPKPV